MRGRQIWTPSAQLAAVRFVPTWVKFTVTHTQLQAAATTNNIELFLLPAGALIHMTKIKHSASFTGGAISAYTLSVGITGTLAKYHSAFNVFQTPGNTVFSASTTIGTEDHATAISIKVAAVSTGANLNASTAGSADIWCLLSRAV